MIKKQLAKKEKVKYNRSNSVKHKCTQDKDKAKKKNHEVKKDEQETESGDCRSNGNGRAAVCHAAE